jgi:hypothetical protein
MGLHIEYQKRKTQAQQTRQTSFRTPDDDQLRSKHVVYSVVLNGFKKIHFVYVVNCKQSFKGVLHVRLYMRDIC